MSKMIPKEKLDAAIEKVRDYYHGGYDEDVLRDMMAACREVEKACGFSLHAMIDLLVGIVRHGGMKPDATNEDIYKVLEVLGWSVE
jgi:uncharacterized protein YutE (UPF0331/DUF86 family)